MVIDERLSVYINSLLWDIPEYLQETEKKALEEEVPVIKRSTQTLLAFLESEYTSHANIIDTIEKVPARIKSARENFQKFNKEGRINLIEGDANKVLWQLAEQEKKYGFVFMDAAKGQYMNFAEPVYKLLVTGGMLVTEWDTIILPVGDGVAVSVKQDRGSTKDSQGQQNGD